MWPFSSESIYARPTKTPPAILADLSLENPSTPLSSPAAWLYESTGAAQSFAGPSVSETSAMRAVAVYACVSLKAGLIADIPIHVYKRTATGRKLSDQHRLYPMLLDEPSDLMSAFTWKELMATNLLLAGNHYSIIERDGAARTTGFLPVPPSQVVTHRVNGRNRYTMTFPEGVEYYDQADVIHVPGLGFDGIKGLSPIGWAGRQPVGVSLALEESVARLHANGLQPNMAIAMPKGISEAAAKRFKAEAESLYTGIQNRGKTLWLDNGATATQMSISATDAQTLEERRFSIADIGRLFGVPPHLIGETDKTTSWGTGIEQQTLSFLRFSLSRDFRRIEGELNRKLFSGGFYCEFDREALLALDAVTQSTVFAQGVMNARYTPNEVRRKTNLPDMPDGNQLFIQSATVPLKMAGQQQSAAPATPEGDDGAPDTDPATEPKTP